MSTFEYNTVGCSVLTQELASAQPRLRSDLQVKLLTYEEHPWYLIEDPVRGKYYRIGAVEYVFISALDGRTLSEVIAVTASQCGQEAFSEDEATSLCRWLIDADLIETDASRSFERLVESSIHQLKLSRRAWLNPIMLKIPLFDPQPLVSRISELCGWFISLPMLAVWCIVCGSAGLTLLGDWQRFQSTASNVIDPNNWLWLCVTWIGLKSLHESGHALACQRFGGSVRECGVLFLLFIPMPYVDVSSSWRFTEKWERIVTAAAGMLFEFFIAAIAVFIWSKSPSPVVQQHAMNIIITATLVTLFFNANPLMRFDGYYILTDWLELPNLATRARTTMRNWQRYFFFGLSSQNPQRSEKFRWLVRIYAVASSLWMLTVTLSIAIGAANLLPGIGLLLAMISIALWLLPSLFGLLKFLIRGSEYEQPHRLRFVAVCTILITCVWWFVEHTPAPQTLSAPFVVEYENLQSVRNRVGGTVKNIHVQQGSRVMQGDVLLELENPEMLAELSMLNVSVRQSELKLRNQIQHQETAAAQVESENLAALQARQRELEDLIDSLIIMADEDGEVLTPDLQQQQGVYLRPGSKIMEIANRNHVKALALIDPEDLHQEMNSVAVLSKHTVHVRLWGSNETFVGELMQVTPKASFQLPHLALGANAGGPLAVRPANHSTQSATMEWMLIQPKVVAEIRLVSTDNNQHDVVTQRTGQTGIVTFAINRGSLRTWITNTTWDWWTTHFQPQHGV